jgi:uncharacterized iron-regulated protein
MRRITLLATATLAALLLAACATPARLDEAERARLAALLPADVLLLGEQHDAPEHHRLERATVQWLAARGQLAALVLEMAEQGHDTAGLPPGASQAQVRRALAWDQAGWPWADYGPVVMAAVRAGVPVWGANLPRADMRHAMQDASLDTRLPPAAWAEQQRRIRAGHCNLLPDRQIVPMTRIQVARDAAMADTVVRALQPGRTVLLVAGNGHVQRGLGIPQYLPGNIKAKVVSARTQQAQKAIEKKRLACNPTRAPTRSGPPRRCPARPLRRPALSLAQLSCSVLVGVVGPPVVTVGHAIAVVVAAVAHVAVMAVAPGRRTGMPGWRSQRSGRYTQRGPSATHMGAT